MKYFFIISLVVLNVLVVVMPSCNIINPEEETPFYITVDTIRLQANPYTQGSSQHGFADCWLYVNSQLIGVFEPPFTVPVLESGECDIIVQAGIKNNGSQSTRVIYPFVNDYTIDVSPQANEDIIVEPIFAYEDASFGLIEDFEDLGISFETTESSDTIVYLVTNDDAQEGTSLAFYLDDDNLNFECKSSELYVLPRNSPVYAEISFKCTDNFVFGFFARKYSGGNVFEERIPIITLFQTDEWKTIYVSLGEAILNESDAYDFRLFFTCSRPEDATNSETKVFIDNFKLVHL